VAKQQLPATLKVAIPVDSRSAHYDEPIAKTKWDGCRTDALWADSAPSLIHERLRKEFVTSKLFLASEADPAHSSSLVLKSEIHAFCSQAVGVLFVRIAGIVAVKFSLERDGKLLWEQKIERVVTDADPDYTGTQVGFLEQGMRTVMSDSLRLMLRDLLKAIERDLPTLLQRTTSSAPSLQDMDGLHGRGEA
jgi:hypothetical protein